MGEILALAWKDVRLMIRDRMGFFFILVFPVVYALFFGMIFRGMMGGGGSSKIDLAIADLDGSEASGRLVAALEEHESLAVNKAASADEGRSMVRLRRADACLIVPKGFGEDMARPFWGEPTALELATDPSRGAEAGMLQGVVMQKAFEQMSKVFTQPSAMRGSMQNALAELDSAPPQDQAKLAPLRVFLTSVDSFFASDFMQESDGTPSPDNPMAEGWQPIKIETKSVASDASGRPTTPWDITFPQSIMWALMSCSFGFALSLVIERRNGTLTRLQVAPTRKWQILGGKLLAFLIVAMGVMGLLVSIGFGLGMRPDSLGGLAAAAGSSAVAFGGIMMLLSVCGKTEASVNGIGWGVMMVMAMIGGAMVPRFAMPAWMKDAGMVSPIGWGLEALEGAIWRDYSAGQLALPCAVLVGIGVAGFAVGAKVFDWKGGE